MKVRSIIAMLLILLTGVIAGCGGSSSGTTDDTPPQMKNDTNTALEEDMNISLASLESGIYTFYNAGANAYLSFSDKTITLSDTYTEWYLEPYTNTGYYVSIEDADLVLDIDNAYIADGTTIKLWENTGYNTQLWSICANENGTYSLISDVNNDYCLGFNNGNALLQIRDRNNSMQEWQVVMISSKPLEYCQYFSTGGIIELRLPLDIHTVITKERLQQWANDLETAYYTFYELTNYIPHETIIVEAYKTNEHFAYVTANSNVIRFNVDYIYPDLKNMVARNNDWNFACLHEMGHMFDFYRPWNFEAEAMTDIKVAYVLEKNNAAAAPFEFPANEYFYGADIKNAYKRLGQDFSQVYDIYGCAERFLEIKEDIGWEPFIKTYHEMQANYDLYNTTSKQEMLNNFVRLLSEYSGRDIKAYFTSGEWNAILSKISN